jgi:GMP synthase-like glutamine amidotransferase
MRLGILKTGGPPRAAEGFGTYPEMFRKLLGEEAFDYRVFGVDEGELPEAPTACDAYLVTGSPAGAYEPLPWIAELKGFLNAVKGQAKLVGVCFGHQVMAEAFGGRVVKSPKGFGLGEQTYRVLRQEPWMDGVGEVRLPGTHQDQVVQAPPGAEVVAGSDFTPIGALAYRDQPAISIQLHPEFEPVFAVALLETHRGRLLTDAETDRAIATYGTGACGRLDPEVPWGGVLKSFSPLREKVARDSGSDEGSLRPRP